MVKKISKKKKISNNNNNYNNNSNNNMRSIKVHPLQLKNLSYLHIESGKQKKY